MPRYTASLAFNRANADRTSIISVSSHSTIMLVEKVGLWNSGGGDGRRSWLLRHSNHPAIIHAHAPIITFSSLAIIIFFTQHRKIFLKEKKLADRNDPGTILKAPNVYPTVSHLCMSWSCLSDNICIKRPNTLLQLMKPWYLFKKKKRFDN